MKGLKSFEIGSILPSLAKARYNSTPAIHQLSTILVKELQRDTEQAAPHFLKILVERLISLDYSNTEEAKEFFRALRYLIAAKKKDIERSQN